MSDEQQTQPKKEEEEKEAQFSDEQIEEIVNKDGAFFDGRYYYGLGRRKTSTAQVKLFTKGTEKKFLVNGVDYKEYFTDPRRISEIEKPLETMKALDKFSIKVKVAGGGKSGQAGAIRLGISRALEEFNPDFRKRLRRRGLLTRDSRMVERKKYGKKKARRSPQWSKR